MALKEVGVKFVAENFSSFQDSIDRGNKALHQFGDDAERAGGRVGGFSQIAIGALRELGAIAVQSLAAAGGAFIDFLGDSVRQAGDFEANMNKFAAVTGGALQDAGLSLKDFHDLFLQLGAETQFSAQDAQEAAIALAKGGVSVEEIMGEATQATLNLAAAADLELGPAADIVAKQLGVWRDSGIDATMITDLLAQAANASTVDVDELAVGLNNAGGAAKAAGVEYKDLVTTMALIAPNFSSASEAGTSFKNFIVRLQPATKDATDAMRELGLFTTATGSVFYDTQGNFIGMEQAAEKLQVATAGLTDAQRIETLHRIFGNDALVVSEALARKGGEGYLQMAADMENAGTALAQSQAQQVGLNFALEQLSGSFDTLKIVIGEALLPVLTSLVNDYLVPGVNAFMSFSQAVLSSNDPLATLTSTIMASSPVLTNVAQTVIPALSQAWNFISTTVIPAAIQVVTDLQARWQELQPALTSVMLSIQSIVNTVFTAIATFLAAHGEEIKAFLTEAWTTINQIISLAIAIINETIVPAFQAIAAYISAHGTEIQAILEGVWMAIQTVIQTTLGLIRGILQTVLAIIRGDWEGAWSGIKNIVETVMGFIRGIIDAGMTIIKGLFAGSHDALKSITASAWGAIQDIIDFSWGQIKAVIDSALALIKGLITGALAFIQGDFSGAWSAIQTAASTAWSYLQNTIIGDALARIKGLVTETINALPGIISSIGGALYGAGAAILQQLWDGMASVFNDAIAWFSQKAQEIADLLPGSEPRDPSSPLRGLQDRGKAIIANIQEGMQASAPLFTDEFKSAVATLGIDFDTWIKKPENKQYTQPDMSAQQIYNRSSTQTTQNTTNYNLTAQYAAQSERRLVDDIRMLQLLEAPG